MRPLSSLSDAELMELAKQAEGGELAKLSDSELEGLAAGAGVTDEASLAVQNISPLEAGIQAYGKNISLGYLPKLQAAIEQLLPDPTAAADEKVRSQIEGVQIHEAPESYDRSRKEFERYDKAALEQNPASYFTGSIASAFSPLGIPAANASSLAGKIASGALTGGIAGLFYNPGEDSEGLEVNKRFKNAGSGALYGAGAGVLGYGLGKGIERFKGRGAEKAAQEAEELAAEEVTKRAQALAPELPPEVPPELPKTPRQLALDDSELPKRTLRPRDILSNDLEGESILPPEGAESGLPRIEFDNPIGQEQTKLTGFGDTVGEATKGVAKSIYRTPIEIIRETRQDFRPVRAKDYKQIKNILYKNNIISSDEDIPLALEFGQNSTIGQDALRRLELPGEDFDRQKFFDFSNALNKALESKVKEAGRGVEIDPITIGQYIKDVYRLSQERLFENADVTYKTVVKNMPGLRFSQASMNTINRLLDKYEYLTNIDIQKGIGNSQSMPYETLKAVQLVRNAFADPDQFPEVVDALNRIGRAAFGKSRATDALAVDKPLMKELYHALRAETYKTVGRANKTQAKLLAQNNAIFDKYFSKERPVFKLLEDGDPSPEVVYRHFIKNPNYNAVKQLEETFTRDLTNIRMKNEAQANAILAPIRAAHLNSHIKYTKAGFIDYKGTAKSLRDSQVAGLYLKDLPELQDVKDLVYVGQRLGDKVFNTSKTYLGQEYGNFDYSGIFAPLKTTIQKTTRAHSKERFKQMIEDARKRSMEGGE